MLQRDRQRQTEKLIISHDADYLSLNNVGNQLLVKTSTQLGVKNLFHSRNDQEV